MFIYFGAENFGNNFTSFKLNIFAARYTKDIRVKRVHVDTLKKSNPLAVHLSLVSTSTYLGNVEVQEVHTHTGIHVDTWSKADLR